jgi:hypothetical protein
MIVRVTPNSDRAKEIITERKEAERKELEFKRREAEIRPNTLSLGSAAACFDPIGSQ